MSDLTMPWECDGELLYTDERYEFWLDGELTEYAERPLSPMSGIRGLTGHFVAAIRNVNNGEYLYRTVFNSDGDPLFDSEVLEGITEWLDMYKQYIGE